MKFKPLTQPLALILGVVAALVAGCAGMPAERQSGVQRMYVLYCGEGRSADMSRWTPGVAENVGRPIVLSNSCYLIQHAQGWMLWETGYSQSIAGLPGGFEAGALTWSWRAPKTLTEQLAELGVTPAQITRLGFSHTHPDHVGNANLFSAATVYIQEPEYERIFGPKAKPPAGPARYDQLRGSPTVKLHGDYDVFGDGSVVIISTPGHTEGHQSLLVRLPKTGPVVLSGDLAHFRDNWVHRRSPVQNFSKEQTLASMEKLAGVLGATKAQLWINHDPAETAALPAAPAYVE
jgi:glyoxylase-like metal-dependent hydrolase (beta-lactamase superfamily II)